MGRKDERIKGIVKNVENQVRHAYNCGYTDGYDARRIKDMNSDEKLKFGVNLEIIEGILSGLEKQELKLMEKEKKEEAKGIKWAIDSIEKQVQTYINKGQEYNELRED